MNQHLLHFAAELAAFLLVIGLILKFVWPMLRRSAEEKQDAVARQVEESEEAARNLEAAQRRFDDALAEAGREAAKIRDDARADAESIRQELREQAEREVERIKQRGEEQLAAQRDQVMRELRAEISALSFETARQKVLASLSDDASKGATVDTFLGELDRLPAAGSSERPAAVQGGVN
jgi:ATP synthase F0 subunit b